MNQLRDVWRIRYREYTRGRGVVGWDREGLWVMPYEADARAAARDAAVGMARRSMVPGSADEYPLIRETSVFRMECGTPIEEACETVTRTSLDARTLFDDGVCPLDLKEDGVLIETRNRWAEARRN